MSDITSISTVSELDQEQPSGGLNPYDFLFVVFKHKWKITLCALVGIALGATYYFLLPPVYESDAKVLLRYLVDRSAVDTVDGSNGGASKMSEAVVNSEIEILTSWDLYEQVVDLIGVDRLLPKSKGTATKVQAAKSIAAGLTVNSGRSPNIILVSYRNGDPELTVAVLDALLKCYYTKHLEVHRSKTSFDLVSQQTELIRGALSKTEADLKAKKESLDIISLKDTAAAVNIELNESESEINAANVGLARERALVAELQKSRGLPAPASSGKTESASWDAAPVKLSMSAQETAHTGTATVHASVEEVEKYQACLDEIAALRKRDLQLRVTYNPDSRPIKLIQSELADLENQRHDYERKFPDLLAKAAPSGTSVAHSQELDYSIECVRLVSMEAGMKALQERLRSAQERVKQFAKVAPEIEELERKKQIEQQNYTNARSKLDSATTDETLDWSKMPNMNPVQKPSPAMQVIGTRLKFALALAGGGLGLGLLLAFLFEVVLDQTLKRPAELERRLRIPLLLSIPFVVSPGDRKRSGRTGDKLAKNASVVPWEATHFIRSYAEAIRDRLSLYFEVNNLRHKPKLIAVTGFPKDSGASTLAGGLAAALSETGDGKVLLVDMNVGQGEIHPFFQGKPACSLTTALKADRPITSAAENLYLASGSEPEAENRERAQFGLKRFHDLMPDFKASDFDFIVFDMPPMGPMSPTAGMARFMDRVLLVLESEKCNREVVKRTYHELSADRGDVAVVLNKVRSYAPKWVEGVL